jgi:hypothetical protein
MKAFYDGMAKIAGDSSYVKDFLAGVDPTGTKTFDYGMKNKKNHSAHRAIGTAGGLLRGGGGLKSRLARGGSAFVNGIKEPIEGPIRAFRGLKKMKQYRAGTATIENVTDDENVRFIAGKTPMGFLNRKPGGGGNLDFDIRNLRAASQNKDELLDKGLQAGNKVLGEGIGALGLSGLIGGGSAYLQYSKAQNVSSSRNDK